MTGQRHAQMASALFFVLSLWLISTARMSAAQEEWKVGQAYTGMVFLDGHYLAPPYHVRATQEHVTVNGRVVRSFVGGSRRARMERGMRFDRERRRANATPPTSEGVARRILRELDEGSVIVSMPGQADVATKLDSSSTEYALVALMLTPAAKRVVDEIDAILPTGVDPVAWREWLTGYEPSAELVVSLRAYQDEVDQVGAANQSQVDSVRRLNSFAYPLTTIGMLLSAVSIGHLLRNPAGGNRHDIEMSQATPLVARSLVLVILLSALDLAWTVLASQAGQMRELNPIGGGLIENVWALIIFKAAITFGAAAILFRLRQHQTAQSGAWWACLICTLLTVRWLVLNSLFIA